MVSDKLKEIIFKGLYSELKDVEIIPYEKSIFFIDRKNKYWYLEYDESKILWWRYTFFENFFSIFSIDDDMEYSKIISEWVQEVLNCEILKSNSLFYNPSRQSEEVLNLDISSAHGCYTGNIIMVNEVLKTRISMSTSKHKVNEILNFTVDSVKSFPFDSFSKLDKLLNKS